MEVFLCVRCFDQIKKLMFFPTRKAVDDRREVVGGVGLGRVWFFFVPGLFKMPGTPKKIAGLITHYFGGNRTPKLGNSDFETTSKQGLTGRGSRVYPNDRGSRVYPNGRDSGARPGRGSRVYPYGRGSRVRPGRGRGGARASPSRFALCTRSRFGLQPHHN